MVLFADQIVGRAEQLGFLDAALTELDRRRRAAVVLVGEPGIGKTRLLAELAGHAENGGHLVLSGSASELERDLPFWVFVDALDEYVQGLEPRRLEALDDDVRTELAHVFPCLSSFAGARGPAFQHERYRAHRAVRELLERLASTQPLVLVLDDLHWADPASVELLGALLRRPPAAAVLIALAVRPGQAPARLAAALRRAQQAAILVRVDVGELTLGEAREMLGDGVGDAAATALYKESGGNPFYLEQLARAPGGLGMAAAPEPSLTRQEVPQAVAEALTEELTCLSPNGRLVLESAAVVGDPFEPELAAAAAATREGLVLEAVDELLRLDLVRQTDVPRRFRFRHPLVRRAVYESSPGAWRLGAHERSAQALAARGAPAIERAHHIERFARQGDMAAVRTLREAGDAAAARAPGSAATWLGVALRLLPGTRRSTCGSNC